MKKWLWIPVVTLVLTSAVVFAVAYRIRCRQSYASSPLQDVTALQKELKLSNAQAAEIEKLAAGLSKKMDGCCEAHCAARFELSQALAQPTVDTNKTAGCVERMCAAQADGEQATLAYLLKVRSLLNPDQQKRYAALLNEQTLHLSNEPTPPGPMKLTSLLLLLLPVSLAAAPVEVARSLTLDQLVSTALAQNPQLKAAQARWEAMRERPAQATTLPNPMFTYSGMDSVDNGTWPATNEKRYRLEQSFPWFGKLALKGKIAGKDAEAMGREFDSMAREVVMMVKETYFDLYGIQQARALTRAEEGVLSNMLKSAESMYATGGRTQQDIIKAQTEITMLHQKLLGYDQQEFTLNAKLNQLLNQPGSTSLIIAVTPPPAIEERTLDQLLALAGGSRPDIKKADAEIQRNDVERQLMKKEFFPDYQLGVEYRTINDGENLLMFTVGFELPIWRSKYKAAEREAEKMTQSSRAARVAVQQQAEFDVRDAHFKLQTAHRTLELYRKELIPQADLRFKASDAAYRTGKGEFLDLLESERFQLDARVMTAMAEANVGMQLARLERAVGTNLEEKK